MLITERIKKVWGGTGLTYYKSDFKILISVIVIILLNFYLITRAYTPTGSDESDIHTIKGVDDFEISTNIANGCKGPNLNSCKYTKYFVDNIQAMIRNNGLNKTIEYVRGNKEQFINSYGDYFFIYERTATGFKYLYHHNPDMDNMTDTDIARETKSNNNVRTKKGLSANLQGITPNLHGILTNLSELSDNDYYGFTDYDWIDPISGQKVKKRTYCTKMNVFLTSDKKRQKSKGKQIYIASGFSLPDTTKEYDTKSVMIVTGGNLCFLSLWKALKIDDLLDHSNFTNILFVIINSLFYTKALNAYRETDSYDNEKREAEENYRKSVGFAGLTLSLVFLSKEVSRTIQKQSTFIVFIKFLCVSFIFSVLSLVGFTNEYTINGIKYGTEINSMLIFNAMIMTFVGIVYIFKEMSETNDTLLSSNFI